MIVRAGPHSDLFSLLYTSLLLLALLSMAASTRWFIKCPHRKRDETLMLIFIRGLRADSATGREVCLLVWHQKIICLSVCLVFVFVSVFLLLFG